MVNLVADVRMMVPVGFQALTELPAGDIRTANRLAAKGLLDLEPGKYRVNQVGIDRAKQIY